MINKNKCSLLLLGIIIAIGTMAQERIENHYPDTIRMTIDKVDVTFAFHRISKKSSYYTNDLWKSTINVMETAVSNSSIEGGKRVTYRKVMKNEEEVGQVSVEALPIKETYLIGLSKTTSLEYDRVEFNLLQKDLSVSFSVNSMVEFQAIKELKIESLWQQIDQKYKDRGSRNLYAGEGKFSYGNAQLNSIGTTGTGNDQVEITFIGVGLGYYRDRFVPDLGSKLSFHLQDRLGNDWMEFGFLYTQQYFFTRDQVTLDYNLDLNGWVSGFWKLNTRSNYEFGLGVGSLMHRDGDYFRGSTWKMTIFTDSKSSNLTFSPELIFTNDFKDAFPALRVGLTF